MSSMVSLVMGQVLFALEAGPAPGLSTRGRLHVAGRAGRAEWSACGSAEPFEALGEAAGVALLGAGQGLEPFGDVLEALVAGGLREARVHLRVLVGLTGDGRLQVVGGGADGHVGDGVADLGQE